MNRILIVEDDPNTLWGLVELLNLEGYIARGACSGQVAFELANAENFEIVLCDYVLPDIDGLSLCCQLKQLNANLTLFLISALSPSQFKRTTNLCGIQKVFSKPLELDDFFKTLAFAAHKKIMVKIKDQI